MNDTLNVLLTLRGIEQVINANCSFQEMFLKLVVLARFKACLALSIGSEIPETNVASVLRALGFSFILSFSVMGATGLGQAQTVSDPNGFALPSTAQTSDVSPASASISGVVLDPSGAVVRGATIRVTGANVATERTAVADDQGRFTFSDLPVGIFKVTVASGTGLTTFTSDAVTLAAGQKLELPPITLRITVASSDVHVVGAATTQEEVAQAQIQAQEKQRVLGIIPNFYSSYIWNAAPMASKQKFGLALRSTTDPVAFMVAGGVAGVEQWHHTFPGYGRGSEGYLKRYGAAYADNAIGRMVGSAILPSLFHQDPRYFYKGSGSVSSRTWYAISQTVISRGDNGRSQPNYSHVLGNFAAAGISNLYRAPQDRSASLTIRNAFIITGSNAIGNLVREFLLRKLTPKVPDDAQGKP